MGITQPETCVALANGQVRAAYALRDDMLAVLFPRGGALPSELLQSRVRIKLNALISGIERALVGGDASASISWPTLSASGLLRETAFIDFALARIAEDALHANLRVAENASPLNRLPVLLLGHENERIASMARALLHAEQVCAQGDAFLFHRLGNEHLHLLCWRVAAALIAAGTAPNATITAAAQDVLKQHDARFDPLAIARKLTFFLGSDHGDAIADPRRAGLHLFVAGLCQSYSLDENFVFRLIGDEHPAALLLLLKGRETSAEAAELVVITLKGPQALASYPDWAADYAAMTGIDARATVLMWREGAVE